MRRALDPARYESQPSVLGGALNLRVLVLAVVVSALTLGQVSAAEARIRTTRYFTINVVPPTSSSSALFLGTGAGYNPRPGVRLTPYTPGRLDLHWTYAPNEEWPAFDTVTGSWDPPFGFTPGTFGVWRKFVNRASGMCLTLGSYANGIAVGQGRCARTGVGITRQMWFFSYRSADTQFEQGTATQKQCLDVTDFRYAADTPLQGWRCQPNRPWNQRFRLAGVAVATCEIGVTNNLCGLSRPPP